MEKLAIKQIGRYQILDVIGRGGMGVVYRAIDTTIDRRVAIKMLLGGGEEDRDNLLARFHREARSTANLQHQNIVTVYALDDLDGFPYMVMEYLEGKSMAEMINSREQIPLVDKIGLVCQVCDGLQYAHDRNVIHRDIKPANILVLKDGVAKIVDFAWRRPKPPSEPISPRSGRPRCFIFEFYADLSASSPNDFARFAHE